MPGIRPFFDAVTTIVWDEPGVSIPLVGFVESQLADSTRVQFISALPSFVRFRFADRVERPPFVASRNVNEVGLILGCGVVRAKFFVTTASSTSSKADCEAVV